MNKIFRYLFFVIGYLSFVNGHFSFSQNLVYNPGFESDSGAVIHDYSQWLAGNTVVDGWYVPTDGTSDYYNSHQSTIKGHPIPKARTGQGRVGMIWSNAWQFPYREFITGRLIKPLEKDKKYKVSFYICRYKYAHYSPMQMGAYFSQDSMLQKNYYANIKVNPQIKVEDYTILEDRYYWHKVEGVFTAAGGEKYVTLGNFKQTINDLTSPSIKVSSKFTIVATQGYAYCFIDDVCVEEYSEDMALKEKKPKLYLYLLDCSSSMEREKKFEKARKGIQRSIKNLPPDAQYAVIGFSNKASTIVQPTKTLLYDFADALDTIKTSGATNAIKAVNAAYDLAEANGQFETELIMCTDGQFKLDDSTFYRVIRAGDVRYNLLQIGGRRIPYLEQLMNATGGKYVVAQSKHVKEELTNLSASTTSNLGEVEYTKAMKGRVIAKWTLVVCLVSLLIFAV